MCSERVSESGPGRTAGPGWYIRARAPVDTGAASATIAGRGGLTATGRVRSSSSTPQPPWGMYIEVHVYGYVGCRARSCTKSRLCLLHDAVAGSKSRSCLRRSCHMRLQRMRIDARRAYGDTTLVYTCSPGARQRTGSSRSTLAVRLQLGS
ncbi:hypothetical protein BD311DRAFT_762578 [Dichomitus squalens]|uniref:Uncharacterized protein n=1 Tax=Dichomitus squalens TaxID=114155 RepID=A0A4Q9MG63_9APHY|nr:hypothetical protein BD311DRAFT_762578 [Dichomitus squalens]